MKSICITLPETPERTERVKAHFDDIGMVAHFLTGVHGLNFGLMTHHTYDYDHPQSGYRIAAKHVGLCLSHYMAWSACLAMDDDTFLIMEDDVLFVPGYHERMICAVRDAGMFDLLFIGSGNCAGKPITHINGEVFDVRWPQCTHAYIATRRALEFLVSDQRRIFAPIDLALILRSFEKMKVLTVLPRMAAQYGQEIAP